MWILCWLNQINLLKLPACLDTCSQHSWNEKVCNATFTEFTTLLKSSWAVFIVLKQLSRPKAKWIMLNNPLDFASRIVYRISAKQFSCFVVIPFVWDLFHTTRYSSFFNILFIRALRYFAIPPIRRSILSSNRVTLSTQDIVFRNFLATQIFSCFGHESSRWFKR